MSAGQRTPRIAPGGWREVGPVVAGLSRVAGRVTGTEPPAIFLTLVATEDSSGDGCTSPGD